MGDTDMSDERRRFSIAAQQLRNESVRRSLGTLPKVTLPELKPFDLSKLKISKRRKKIEHHDKARR